MPAKKHEITLTVNGVSRDGYVEARRTLADFLREDLALTGTHVGCEHGVCGACTLLVNGEAVRSCLMFAVQANGQEVTTIEGLSNGAALHPIQEAFWECHGMQCGFCTPGFVMSVYAFLKENPTPREEDIRPALSGNICRCTGYQSIVDAVRLAASKMRESHDSTSVAPEV